MFMKGRGDGSQIGIFLLQNVGKNHTSLFLKLAFCQSGGVAIPSPYVINLFKYLLAFI